MDSSVLSTLDSRVNIFNINNYRFSKKLYNYYFKIIICVKAKNIPSNTACLLCAYCCSEVKDSSKKPDPADSAPACPDSPQQKGQ